MPSYLAQTKVNVQRADPYVPDEFFQEDDDDEGWEALRESSKPPEKRQNYQHKHVPQQQQEQQQMQASSPLCLCGDPCVQLTANTATNPGRCGFAVHRDSFLNGTSEAKSYL